MGVKKYDLSQRSQNFFNRVFTLVRKKENTKDNVYTFLSSIGYSEGGLHYYVFINAGLSKGIGTISLYEYECIVSLDNPSVKKVEIWVIPYTEMNSIVLKEEIEMTIKMDSKDHLFYLSIPQKVDKNLPVEHIKNEEKTKDLYEFFIDKVS